MDRYKYHRSSLKEEHWEVELPGHLILQCPILNKGSAFSEEERDRLGIRGLLPPHTSTMEEQLSRTYEHFQKKDSDLEKYIYLISLQSRNETLFYRLLLEHISEMMPIVYTPVVGKACQYYSHLFRVPRGLYLSYPDREKIPQILENLPYSQIETIVVSDGERILGLGDLGVGGIGIPLGKLTLYSLCAGIHPSTTLPIILDVGTDNEELLGDPLYLGWNHERIRGEEYDDFIHLFVQAVKDRFPNVLLQWEDFANRNAFRLLDRYQDQICSFNDDIQGTGAVTLAGLLAACLVKKSRLRDERMIMVGAGSAARGIVEQSLVVMEEQGLERQEACNQIYLLDSKGLVYEGRERVNNDFKRKYATPREEVESWGLPLDRKLELKELIDKIKPTALIGTSAQPGMFTEQIVREMAAHCDRPIIFPLSNPTSKAEARPVDLINWTGGKALVATGSPFDPVSYQGKTFTIGQCNNAFIFPGMGLGIVASRARRVTDSMFVAAAQALAEFSPAQMDPEGSLFPELETVRGVSRKVAYAVGREAQKEGMAPETSEDELQKNIELKMWQPRYIPIEKKDSSTV